MKGIISITNEWDEDFLKRSKLKKFLSSLIYEYGYLEYKFKAKARRNKFTGKVECRYHHWDLWWTWIDINKEFYELFVKEKLPELV